MRNGVYEEKTKKKGPRKRGGEYSDEKPQVLSIWLHNAIARVGEEDDM